MSTHHVQPGAAHAAADLNRRNFIKAAGITTLSLSFAGFSGFVASGVSIVTEADDTIAAAVAPQWAAKELEEALSAKGVKVQRCSSIAQANAGNLCILAASSGSKTAIKLLGKNSIPAVPEAQGLVPATKNGKPMLLAAGHDERGLVYALLELADRVRYADSPASALHFTQPLIEKPNNRVRSLNRLFVSDIEDKPWYNDSDMWPQYLTHLATQRFNKFNLSLGIGYDFLQNVTDGYFVFSYPFFMSVPGYEVHVPELPDAERDNNLAMLQFISAETVKRGMQFQLGLWMHGYEWLNSPHPNYTIKGLSKDTHAAYCRDAVRLLLQKCPDISGVTFRVHGESGVNEGSYAFWKTIFEGVASCGRPVSIDMHAKGIDDEMLNTALSVGVPITVSPKFWAEHWGLPYHQADIRAEEIPKGSKKAGGLMSLSTGSRSFTRYGYGDLLKADRKIDIVHRIWPGTQRLLLWGDPLNGAAYSRAFTFCGSAGVELMEPLSFKGRRGSGIAGNRCGYADALLAPRWDWQKYEYSLRIFGRTLYNPDTRPEVWQRYLRQQFGLGAAGVEQALRNGSRILPLITTAHDPSAGNNNYWPEMYTNQGIARAEVKNPYYDTPKPAVFGLVSSLDPQLFLTLNDYATELLKGERSAKYSPVEVAQWLEDYAKQATAGLSNANQHASGKAKAAYRRMAIDVAMQAGLGRFFAAKFRAGALYCIHQQSGDRTALSESLKLYRQARQHWADLANLAKGIYEPDVTAGPEAFLRGHWLDRLPAMDEDLDFMAKQLDDTATSASARPASVTAAIAACQSKPLRPVDTGRHKPQSSFKPGQSLPIAIKFNDAPKSVTLYYRHINQGERFLSVNMKSEGNTCNAEIPGEYTNSSYHLQYYFEVRHSAQSATIYPGLGLQINDQPYFVVMQG